MSTFAITTKVDNPQGLFNCGDISSISRILCQLGFESLVYFSIHAGAGTRGCVISKVEVDVIEIRNPFHTRVHFEVESHTPAHTQPQMIGLYTIRTGHEITSDCD